MKKDEFVETALDFGQWLEDNWMVIVRYAAVAAVIAVAVLFWYWYSGKNEEKAVEKLARGITRYQQAELGAFTSNTDLEGALELFEEANGLSKRSAAGKSARFYQGAALYRLGRLDEAIPILEEVKEFKEPTTLKGVSGAMLAEALVMAGQMERAVSLLEGMADEVEPAYPADQALLQLARIHFDSGNIAEAQRVWRKIADEHPQTAGAMEANNLLNNPG
jgi:tetratricopeptide (TPR) repeat protein